MTMHIATVVWSLLTMLTAPGDTGVRVSCVTEDGTSIPARICIGRPDDDHAMLVEVLSDLRVTEACEFEVSPGGVEVVAIPDRPGAFPVRTAVQVRPGEMRTVRLVCAPAPSDWTRETDPLVDDALRMDDFSVPLPPEVRTVIVPRDVDPDLARSPAPDQLFRPASRLDLLRPIISALNCGVPLRMVGGSGPDPSRWPANGLRTWRRGELEVIGNGPLIECRVNGFLPGQMAVPADGILHVRLRITAAPHIDLDHVLVLVNGDIVREAVPVATDGEVRLDTRWRLPVSEDGWLMVVAWGDVPLPKVFATQIPHELPLAFTNVVWIDADGDGRIRSPLERATAALDEASDAEHLGELWGASGPWHRRTLLRAARDRADEATESLIRAGLTDQEALVRAEAIRAVRARGLRFLEDLVRFASAMGEDREVSRAVDETPESGTPPVPGRGEGTR
ncbi:MAG: hypothetical protein KDA28_03815 [Phycisphaerales bacterium]|nr:hypothetical protein [Phycisphaerales bacterium]